MKKTTLASAKMLLEENCINAAQFELFCDEALKNIDNIDLADALILKNLRYITEEEYDRKFISCSSLANVEASELYEENMLNYEGKTDIKMN